MPDHSCTGCSSSVITAVKLLNLVWNVMVTQVGCSCILQYIPVHREESISKKGKRITMAQQENGLRNNSFINQTQ